MKTGVKVNFKTDEILDEVAPRLRRYDRTEFLGTSGLPFKLKDLIDEYTGEVVPPGVWAEGKRREKVNEVSTQRMQDLLESGGLEVETPSNVMFVGAVTGLTKVLRRRRNINLLLSVAQMNRREQQLSLAKYLEEHRKGQYARYLVITSGERIPAHADLRQRMSAFGRKISKWANRIKREFGIEVVCRIYEMPRNADGTYNLHANVIYIPPYMGELGWLSFLGDLHTSFDTILQDAGKIDDLNEVIKYVFKGDDIENMDADEAVWLHDALYNMRIFSAFNGYKDFRSELKDSGKKLVSIKGRIVYMLKPKCHRNKDEDDEYDDEDRPEEREHPMEVKNVLLTQLQPTAMLSPVKEPVMVIQGYDPSIDITKDTRAAARYIDIMMCRAEATDAWRKNTSITVETARAYGEAVKNGAT
ncbi:hypothetical protein ACGYK4_17195, partial [Sulfitobacter sp. 1A13368]|uniref:hypothetical protein n=1 Tax=Sulfitobacter sp. 1A13368 TaxID=3368593 RepID=UPI00374763CD